MAKHQNLQLCLKCEEILNRYQGFNKHLRVWFYELREAYPEAHISCAGRGKQAQDELYRRQATKASFGNSAHNFNAALDVFQQEKGCTIYDEEWFMRVVEPAIDDKLTWYGYPNATFRELPHVELKNWRELAKNGRLTLVEPADAD